MSSYQVNPLEILDTTNSTGVGSGGSLTIGGGISIGRDTYIGGNINVLGADASFADNIIILNNNTLGSTDTGILLKRAAADVTISNNFSSILYSETSDTFKFGYVTADTRGTLTINSLVPIETSGLTTGNINFTGSLYQNGTLFTGTSQWSTGGNNSIFYTSGSVGIGTTSPVNTLDVTGTIRATTGITTGTLLATTSISSASIQGTNSTITNAVHTALTTGSLNIINDLSTSSMLVRTFNRTLDTIANSSTEICSISTTHGAYIVYLNVVHSESSSSEAKTYIVPIQYNSTGGAWKRLAPFSSGPYGANDWAIDMTSNGSWSTFRLVRVSGTVSTIGFTCTLTVYQSSTRPVTISDISGTAGSVTNTGVYESTQISQVNSLVGINTDAPLFTLDVNGSMRATTGITTATLLATTITATTYTGGSMQLSGSVTSANLEVTGLGDIINLTSTQATLQNLRTTNITTNSIVVTGGSLNATFNSNTVGALTTTGGNVGVGTVTPSYKLDINGTLRATGGDITVGTLRLTSTTVALGSSAGVTAQGASTVAIGNQAGNTSQGNSSVAIGIQAGQNYQASLAVAIGSAAGQNSQGNHSVAIGENTAQYYQQPSAVAIGYQAGQTSQGNSAVALGCLAGTYSQGTTAIAIGLLAANSYQGIQSIAIGFNAGQNSQGPYAVAIGSSTAVNLQGQYATAVGIGAGASSQGSQAVAIGGYASATAQGSNAVGVGYGSGQYYQGINGVAMGYLASQLSQGNYAIGIGYQASNVAQGSQSVAIGFRAGQNYQAGGAVAIGLNAAQNSQGASAVAIGGGAGQKVQSSSAVAMGVNAGQNYQGINSVAVGIQSGQSSQGAYAVAMGNNAGQTSQGAYGVAIGNAAGQTSQHDNSIILNASVTALNSGTAGAFYVNPVRNVEQTTVLGYNTTNKEITYWSTSNFTSSNIVATNISTGTINATTYTGGSMSLSGNLNVAGTLTVVNITSTNMVESNITANSIVVTGGSLNATFNSNTFGPMITTGGNVGIGTTSPSGKLHIAGDGTVLTSTFQTNRVWSIINPSGIEINAPIIFQTNNAWDFQTDNLSRLYVKDDGNIGINTTAPQFNLDVNGVINASAGIIGSVISTGGNVGINTTSPSAKLDVGGNMKISSNTESYIYDVTGGTYMYMNAVSTSNSSGYARLGGYSTVSGTQALSLQPAGGNTGIGTTAPSYTLDVNGNMRVSTDTLVSGNLSAISNVNTMGSIITTGGNVGIGTIVPSFKLDISGNARISTGITTNTLLASTNISTGLLQATSIGSIGLSSTNIFASSSTMGVLRVSTLTTTANLAAGLITSASMQVNTILANTSITTANLLVTTNASVGQLASANMTTNNLIVNTLVSSANIQSVLMTTGTLLSNLITVNNLVNTNLSTGSINASNINVTNATITNSVHTNISASNFVGGVYNGSNITISGTTASVVYTGGSMSLSGNLTIGGTLIYVNTTNDNYVYTNVTAATLRVTSSLASVTNTNTIGNIITTGGNVGIGNTAPSYLLDVNGSMRTNSINLKGASSGNISISAPAVAGTQNYIFPASVPTNANYVMSSNSSGTLNWVSPHHIGDMAARQIDSTFLEMNGQIVNQGSYGTLYTSLGHQPEFKFSVSNLESGLYSSQNILNGNNSYGKNNIGRFGSQILAVGGGGLMYSSTDDGTSWSLGACAPFGTTSITLSGYFGGTWNRWIIGANGSNLIADSTDNGRTWTNRAAGNYNRWDYAFNETDSVGIVVGSSGGIFRSTNGTTWAQATYTAIGTTTVGTATLRCAGFATINTTKTFVSAGDGGVIIYSTDNALTWTPVPDITNTLVFNKIKWVGGSINRFILGGNTNILYTSLDGITWTLQTISGSTGNIQDMVTDETDGFIVLGSSGGVTYSTNATTWTLLTFGGGIFSVNYDVTNSKFLAVSDSRYYYASKSSIATWTVVNSIRNKTYRGTCDSNSGGKLFAFSDNGGVIEFNTSTNTDSVKVAPGYNIKDAVYGNGVYVALVTDADSSIFTSTDGITWTYRKFNTTTTNFGFPGRRIKYLNGNFIILSTSVVIFTSTDGVTWTERAIANTTKNDVIWTGTYYVIACDAGTILYSSNLSTWTTVNIFTAIGLMTSLSINVNDITHLGSGIVLAACSSGWIFRSIDHGVNWTGVQLTDVGPYPFAHITTDNSTNIVAVTREGSIIAYSNDSGATWSTYKSTTTSVALLFTGVVYGNGKFIVYGRNSVLGVSEDNGATWEWTGMAGHYEIIDMAYGDGFFMGAGLFNSATLFATPIVVWSPDGKNWTQRTVPHNMVDTALGPKQRINYLNKTWMIASNVTLRSANIWRAPYPYDITTQFQIPTHYLGNGANKMWIKALSE